MWCVIPPGGRSAPDRHPEVEFAVVTRGHAAYESDGHRLELAPGGVIVLDPQQPHIIHNLSDAEPLTILSIYWLPAAAGAEARDGH
jgi:quercetin dioxygenase-like cupin family protein